MKPVHPEGNWYLREDLLPEPIESLNKIYGSVHPKFINSLKEAGNLFTTKDEAIAASEKVRELLCSINNPWCLESK